MKNPISSRYFVIPAACLALTAAVIGDPPSWWSVGDPPVITGGEENNHGPANIGQAKWMASEALRALDSVAPDIATQIRSDLSGTPAESSNRIIDLGIPDPKPSGWADQQKAPLLIGQLKAISAPFYSRLHAVAPEWLASQRLINQTQDPADPTFIYPWTNQQDDDSNKTMATIGQLKAVFSLRFDSDGDGDGLSDILEAKQGTNPNNADTDGDGLTDQEEMDQGTDPNNSNTDGDMFEGLPLKDGQDAVPTEAEINWKRTPEARYAWIEQLETPTDNFGDPIAPVAVNKNGQILFPRFTAIQSGPGGDIPEHVLWNSAQKDWEPLSPAGSQQVEVELNSVTNQQTLTAQAVFFFDINDDGTIVGVTGHDRHFDAPPGSNSAPDDLMTFGMIWENSGPPANVYAPPRYFFKEETVELGEFPTIGQSVVTVESPLAAIANDGSVNVLFHYAVGAPTLHTDWSIHDSASESKDCAAVKTFPYGYNSNDDQIMAGAILDKNRALFMESSNLGQGAKLCHLWLKEGASQTDLSFMTPQPVDLAEMSYTPLKKLVSDSNNRLLITTGDRVYVERSDGGSGTDRWRNLTDKDSPSAKENCMAEGAIRLNARGEAITRGNPDTELPPKLWRNGKYIDLNDERLTSKPSSVQITDAIDLASNGIILVQATEGEGENAVKKTGLLVPIAVEELSPKLRNEDDQIITGSELPALSPKSTEMVERDPTEGVNLSDASTIRIAWRDMKVKIGEMFIGKKVTWTMTPQFTPSVVTSSGPPEVIAPDPSGPRFRGKWGTAENSVHRHQFSASERYGNMNYESMAQAFESETNSGYTVVAQTTVDGDGYTAIRVNLPPIGFNKARINIEIEGVPDDLDLIDLEVPAVVVIDPGHGGTGRIDRSDGNHATSATGKLEKNMTHSVAKFLRDELRLQSKSQNLRSRIILTRDDDVNMGIGDRAEMSSINGTDDFLSIHFNGDSNLATRGTEVWIYPGSPPPDGFASNEYQAEHTYQQINYEADHRFAARLLNAAVGTIGSPNRGVKEWSLTQVHKDGEPPNTKHASIPAEIYYDQELGNRVIPENLVMNKTISRAALVELEFISNVSADTWFNGSQGAANQQSLAVSMATSILTDIKDSQNP